MSRCLHTEEYRKKEDPSLNLGFNTYGTARMLHDDFDGTMSKLRELGYTSVEPMIFFDGAISCISAMSKRAMLRFWKLDGGIWSSSINAAKRIAAVRTLGFPFRLFKPSGISTSF